MQESVVRARTSVKIKKQTEKIFKKLGLTSSQAIRLFYQQVALHNGLPFDVRIPNEETIKAIKDADNNTNLIKCKNIKEMFKKLEI